MIKVNRKVEYALMALQHIRQNPKKRYTARDIADRFSMPFDTTSKALQVMKEAGIVKSEQGVKGGYQLSTKLTQFSVWRFIELIEGKNIGVACVTGSCDKGGQCNIMAPMQKLDKMLKDYLQHITLQDLLEDTNLVEDLQQKGARVWA